MELIKMLGLLLQGSNVIVIINSNVIIGTDGTVTITNEKSPGYPGPR